MTSFRLQDNLGACEDAAGAGLIAGTILNEEGDSITGVEVTLNTFNPEYPQYDFTEENGSYLFGSNPFYYDYEINNIKDYDYLNGVSTLDLVVIQKHVLGLGQIESPYKLIAADVNNDCKITASDLLQLRKLILGIYENDDLPNNESWRFVTADYEFMDATYPCSYEEISSISNLEDPTTIRDFVGVKIGDVNNSSFANDLIISQTRSNEYLELGYDHEINDANNYELSFYGDNFKDVYGFQFTLELATGQTELIDIISEGLDVERSNFGVNRLENGLLTISWNDTEGMSLSASDKLFTLVFKNNEVGLSNHDLSISSKITPIESYFGNITSVHNINLESRSKDVGYVFELNQNNPNPFAKKTEIKFVIPSSNNTSLEIFNSIGEKLYNYEEFLDAGEHIITIDRKELNSTGVLFYKLVSGDHSAMRKMIVID